MENHHNPINAPQWRTRKWVTAIFYVILGIDTCIVSYAAWLHDLINDKLFSGSTVTYSFGNLLIPSFTGTDKIIVFPYIALGILWALIICMLPKFIKQGQLYTPWRIIWVLLYFLILGVAIINVELGLLTIYYQGSMVIVLEILSPSLIMIVGILSIKLVCPWQHTWFARQI